MWNVRKQRIWLLYILSIFQQLEIKYLYALVLFPTIKINNAQHNF